MKKNGYTVVELAIVLGIFSICYFTATWVISSKLNVNYEEGMYYFSPHTSIPVNFNHQLEMLIMNGLDKVFLTKDLKEKNPEVYKKLSNYTFKNKKVKKLQRNL